MNKKALEINHFECWGCKACEVACKQENNAPDGLKLIEVAEDGPKMVGEKPHFENLLRVCRHCDDPPCMEVCPVEAITKRQNTIVFLNTDECTGCEACIEACPYDAIRFDSKNEIARKCNMCLHRVEAGLIPACADNICLAHCIRFSAAD